MTLVLDDQHPIRDPNFPEHLDIKPSTPAAHITKKDTQSDTDLFGAIAQQDAIQRYGIAGRVWEATYTLNVYVHPPSRWEFDPPFIRDTRPIRNQISMVELGSGIGMVSASIAEALRPSQDILIATDLPEVCTLLGDTLNSRKRLLGATDDVIRVRQLSWGNKEHASQIASEFFDSRKHDRRLSHIICSDLVYFPELFAPLLRTLLQLSSSPFCFLPSTPDISEHELVIIISYKIRSLSKETAFWSAFGLWFKFEPVLVRDPSDDGSWRRFGPSLEDDSFIFVAYRRPESLIWNVPEDDRDLLSGVGAQGTSSRKSDDTFETLLLMTMEEEMT